VDLPPARLGEVRLQLADLSRKRLLRAGTAHRVEKLWRRVKAGEVEPRPRWVPAARTLAVLRELLEGGFSGKQLGAALGYPVVAKTFQLEKIRPETAEKVAAFRRAFAAGQVQRPGCRGELPDIDELASSRPGAAA
jgi:hypothetical protein